MTNLPPLHAEQLRKIEQAVIGDLRPVARLPREEAYLGWLLGLFILVCALGAYFAGQRGWHALDELRRMAVFGLLVAATAALGFAAVRQMSPLAMHAWSASWLSAALFAALLLVFGVMFQPLHESAFVHSGWRCLRLGLLFGIPAGVLFAVLLRRGAGLTPWLTGATVGGLAGLAGLSVLEIHCPNLNVYHIVVWHVSVTVVCIILGFVFSSVTFSRWRSNP